MCLILFGWRGVERETARGEFHCPQCDKTRPYADKSVRRWFTLFFIPVIPLNHLGSYVECPFCGSAYNRAVLNGPATNTDLVFKATVNEAVRRLLVGIAWADGRIDSKEADFAVALAQNVLGDSYTHEWFSADISRLKSEDLLVSMRTFAGMTNEQGKELLLRIATLLSATDGEIDEAEIDLINRIATALGVPTSYVPGIMQDALQNGLETRRDHSPQPPMPRIEG